MFLSKFVHVCYQQLHGAQCLLSNSLVPGCVLVTDPADWAKRSHPVGSRSSAQCRKLPGLSDASLSSPAHSNLLALAWHKVCLCVLVLISVYSSFCHLSLPWSLACRGKAWLTSLVQCRSLFFHARPS